MGVLDKLLETQNGLQCPERSTALSKRQFTLRGTKKTRKRYFFRQGFSTSATSECQAQSVPALPHGCLTARSRGAQRQKSVMYSFQRKKSLARRTPGEWAAGGDARVHELPSTRRDVSRMLRDQACSCICPGRIFTARLGMAA